MGEPAGRGERRNDQGGAKRAEVSCAAALWPHVGPRGEHGMLAFPPWQSTGRRIPPVNALRLACTVQCPSCKQKGARCNNRLCREPSSHAMHTHKKTRTAYLGGRLPWSVWLQSLRRGPFAWRHTSLSSIIGAHMQNKTGDCRRPPPLVAMGHAATRCDCTINLSK